MRIGMVEEEGYLQLKINAERFSVNCWHTGQHWHTSEPVVIDQLPWIIRVNHGRSEGEYHHLRCQVVCNSESQDTRWSCEAIVTLRVIAQNKLLIKSEWNQTFNSQKNSCGYDCFLATTIAADNLLGLHPNRRLLLGNRHFAFDTGTIIVEADIKRQSPNVATSDCTGVLSTCSRDSGPRYGLSLAVRMNYLLSSGKNADVNFLVGYPEGEKQQFAAHKVILATLSDVFDRMFNFDANRGNSDKVIEVTDVKPEAFRVMLDFIYTANLGGLSQQNVFDVLHAANKYNLTDLADACADFPTLDINNVLYSLSKALIYELKGLIGRCWNLIDKNACAVLENDQFLAIDQTLLCNLFARDQLVLYTKEYTVWNAALRWADAQCRKHNMEVTGDNRRNFLGPALFKVRFPLIPKEQFAGAIIPTKVLTEKEIVSVLLYHVHPTNGIPDEYPLVFSNKLRSC